MSHIDKIQIFIPVYLSNLKFTQPLFYIGEFLPTPHQIDIFFPIYIWKNDINTFCKRYSIFIQIRKKNYMLLTKRYVFHIFIFGFDSVWVTLVNKKEIKTLSTENRFQQKQNHSTYWNVWILQNWNVFHTIYEGNFLKKHKIQVTRLINP